MVSWTEDSWSELLAGVVLFTLARHQMDRPLSGRIYASDACHENGAAGGGLAYAEFRQHEIEPVLTDLMLQRGWCKKELDEFVAAGEVTEEQVDQKVRLIEYFCPTVLYSRHWCEAMATRYESELHINFHEMLYLLNGVKHRARSMQNSMGVHLTDSSACFNDSSTPKIKN